VTNGGAYPKYKETGLNWLGQVPASWDVVPLWTLYSRGKSTDFPEEELLSVYRDHGVVPKSSRGDNFNKPSEDLSAYQLVKPGDMVINKMKAWQGSVAISRHRGIVSPAYFVYECHHGMDDRYLHYLLRSERYITGYLSLSKGIRINQWDLDPTYHSRMPVLVPSLQEQRAIVDLLDRETAQIDALIGKQERLIELLVEKRQAIITHAVTKGLDPTASTKPSGVHWLGDIPSEWTINRCSRLFRAQKGREAADLTKEACAEIPGPYPVYSGQTANDGIMARIDHYEFDSGTDGVLFSTTVGARAMSAAHIYGKFSLSQNCMIIRPLRSLNTRYFYYQFQVLFRHERAMIPEHMQPSFRMEDLYAYSLAAPSEIEQRKISDYLDGATKKLDDLALKVTSAVLLLKERRSALISAAVTGKINVTSEGSAA
jgi:type I restriction enzyme S subunit